MLAMLVAASARADAPPAPPPTPAVPAPPEPEPDPNESLIIYVIGTTPLHGSRLPKDHVPANVQTISAEDLADHKSLDLSAYAGESLGSAHINDVQARLSTIASSRSPVCLPFCAETGQGSPAPRRKKS